MNKRRGGGVPSEKGGSKEKKRGGEGGGVEFRKYWVLYIRGRSEPLNLSLNRTSRVCVTIP